jgi:hypothetical protein
MTHAMLNDSGWRALLRRLPAGFDLGASARATRAFRRARGLDSVETLLRLILIYAGSALSLRGTAAWAQAAGLADISDVALLNRLRGAGAWLAEIAAALLTHAARQRVHGPIAGRRVRLIDATSFCGPGPKGAEWRVHADYDLAQGGLIGFEITDNRGAESLGRFMPARGDIFVGDRVYGMIAGPLHDISASGADFLVRRGLTGCTLTTNDGTAIDLAAMLAGVRTGRIVERAVRVPIGEGVAPIDARLIIQRLPPEQAGHARQRAAKAAKGKASPARLDAAEFVILLTSLERRHFSARRVLNLYRLRWQIELAFKRLKSILHLDDLQAKDSRLVRTCLAAKLVIALLTEDRVAAILDSPPSAPRSEIAMAAHAHRPRRPDRRHLRPPRAGQRDLHAQERHAQPR